MLTPQELLTETRALLAGHFERCPYGCNANHLRCSHGRRLMALDDTAWLWSRSATLPPTPYGDNTLEPCTDPVCHPARGPAAGGAS